LYGAADGDDDDDDDDESAKLQQHPLTNDRATGNRLLQVGVSSSDLANNPAVS